MTILHFLPFLLLVMLLGAGGASSLAPSLITPRAMSSSRTATAGNDNNDDDSDDVNPKEADSAYCWERIGPPIATVSSPWMTVIGERLRDNEGKMLDYWRVEKANSVVVVTIYRNQLIFPKPQYRPGLGRSTLDFPGGRCPPSSSGTADDGQEGAAAGAAVVAPKIVARELGIHEDEIEELISLNGNHGDDSGWPINSSFSNQRLFGFAAKLKDEAVLDPNKLYEKRYNTISQQQQDDGASDGDNIQTLLQSNELTCLQCRSVLLEWLQRQQQQQ